VSKISLGAEQYSLNESKKRKRIHPFVQIRFLPYSACLYKIIRFRSVPFVGYDARIKKKQEFDIPSSCIDSAYCTLKNQCEVVILQICLFNLHFQYTIVWKVYYFQKNSFLNNKYRCYSFLQPNNDHLNFLDLHETNGLHACRQ
jgi:hypothetical protein